MRSLEASAAMLTFADSCLSCMEASDGTIRGVSDSCSLRASIQLVDEVCHCLSARRGPVECRCMSAGRSASPNSGMLPRCMCAYQSMKSGLCGFTVGDSVLPCKARPGQSSARRSQDCFIAPQSQRTDIRVHATFVSIAICTSVYTLDSAPSAQQLC